MDAQLSSKPVDSARVGPGARLFRSLLLVVASVWFFLWPFPRRPTPHSAFRTSYVGSPSGLG